MNRWRSAGALLDAELHAVVVTAGFVDFEITWQGDIYAGAPQESSAANFGTLGINFHARKPVNEAEWTAALQALSCDAPLAWAEVN